MKKKLVAIVSITVLLLASCKNQKENTPSTEEYSLSTIEYQQIKIGGELRDRVLKNYDRLESKKYCLNQRLKMTYQKYIVL